MASVLLGISVATWEVFLATWWFVLPVIFMGVFWELWLYYIESYAAAKIKWLLLRVRVPRELLRVPSAMEQVYAALYGTYSFGITPWDKYWNGVVETVTTFEMVGDASGIYFYIRIKNDFRNLIESAIYAQYPQAEIEAVPDYMDDLPEVLPNDFLDIFGADYALAKDSAYPIRTWPEFFEAKNDEERIDPIASLVEVMSKLKGGERMFVQLFLRAKGDDWKKQAEKERDKIIGRKPKKDVGFLDYVFAAINNLFVILVGGEPEWPEDKKEEKPALTSLTKGEQDVARSIEDKVSKLGFEMFVRFAFMDNKSSFSRSNISAVAAFFNQFATLNKNSFRPMRMTAVLGHWAVKWIGKSAKGFAKKRLFWDDFKFRNFAEKTSFMNIEELATIYHYPTILVESPSLRPVEFKKGAPPSNLPLEDLE